MLKFYGQFDPPVDKILYESYFLNKKNGVSIECGSLDGVWDSCTKFFEDNLNWKTINIEPLPCAYKKLTVNRPNSININVALSNNNDTKPFINYKHPTHGYFWGNGSISHTPNHKKTLNIQCGTNNYETINVQCKTYSQIIDENKLTHLDLFVLDVEGHELEVIEGMKNSKIFPDVFVIEYGHISIDHIDNKLKELPIKYILDFTNKVNCFFVKDKVTYQTT